MQKVKTAIEEALGEVLSVRWQPNPEVKVSDKYRADLAAILRFGKKEREVYIEFKTRGEPNIISQVAVYSRYLPENTYLILVAPFVSERGREICKEFGLGFVDFEGNAYIKFDNVFIEKIALSSFRKEKRTLKRLFSTKSTWIIRKLLAEPNREWVTSELAEEANVSLGQVYKVTERLEAEGYLEKKWGSIRLISSGKLLDAWRKKYDFKEQNMVGYYSPVKERNELYKKLKELDRTEYALTLGAAANLVAPFVRSTDNYIYSTDFDIMKTILELEPVEFGGNLYLIEPSDEGVLFDTQIIEGVSVVSNIQLYLDLYKYPARGREQAEFLREKVMEL